MRRTALGAGVGWIGLSMLTDGVPALILPHRLLSEGVTDATSLGLATLFAVALAAVLQPVAGSWSDRVGRLPTIVVGTAIAVCGLALLLSAATALAGTVLALAGASVAQAGYQALMPDRVGVRWLGRASGLKGAFDLGGAFVGFVVIGVLLGAGHDLAAVAIVAVVFVSGFAAARLLLCGGSTRQGGAAAVSGQTDHRALVGLIAARFLFLLGIYVVGRYLLLFVADRLALGADEAAAQAAATLAVLALVTISASIPAGWLSDRVGRGPLMLGGGASAAAGVALLATAASSGEILLFGSLMAIGSAAFGSASWALLGDLVAGPAAGRLMGLANLGTAGAAAAAGGFGFIVDARGFGLAFGFAAASCVLGGIGAWRIPAAATTSGRAIGRVEALG